MAILMWTYVEQKYYTTLKEQNISVDLSSATVITARIPADFVNFPELNPRIFNLRLSQNE